MKKRYLKLIAGLMCFKNVQPISHYWWAIFSASRIKALLVLKDLQPNRPGKATYLANHKKTGLWSWTQLSASPRIVLFRWKSVVDDVDHTVPRAPGRWSGRRRGLGRGRRGAREDAAVEARAERSTRVHWFGCSVRLPSPQNNRGCGWVEGWPDQRWE